MHIPRLSLISTSLVPAGLAAAALAAAAAAATAQGPAPPSLAWPVDCRLGQDCQIQRYLDHDPTAGAKDYACGTRTNDGHDGLDIRLLDMAAQRRGVAVLAAADGQVLRTRDGVDDVSVRERGVEAVDAIGCGNAVVIVHPQGLQTAYCHMAKGSVRVKPGDSVKAGQPIGRVGLSGLTEFPHLHFAVRADGRVVDPFAYGAAAGTCSAGRSLWRETPKYEARVVLNTGFTTTPVTMPAVEAGGLPAATADAPALVAYVRALGLKMGDVQNLSIRAPDGSTAFASPPQPVASNQAQTLLFGGRKRPAQGWSRGRYEATYTVSRDGKPVLAKSFALQL